MKKILFPLLFIALFSCKKVAFLQPKPTATIEYTESDNGTATFTLNSANVTSANWTIEGISYSGLSTSHLFSKNGSFTVSCEIKGDGGAANITRSVKIEKVLGKVIFWQSDGNKYVDVTVSGFVTKTITSNHSATPSCDANGGATYTLYEGTYNFTAKTQQAIPNTWKGTVTVTGGSCYKLKLNN